MDLSLDITHATADIHAPGTPSRFDILTGPVAVTEVLQRVIYMVDILWKYLLCGTFKYQHSRLKYAADL